MSTMTHTTTWQDIIAVEPRLAAIIGEAAAIRKPWWDDYSRLKLRLSQLVGWEARDQRLRTHQAYDVAIDRLAEALRL